MMFSFNLPFVGRRERDPDEPVFDDEPFGAPIIPLSSDEAERRRPLRPEAKPARSD